MLERCSEAHLAGKSLTADFRCQIGPQNLYDYLPPKRFLAGEKDARHSTTAKLTLYGVGVSEGCLEAITEVQRQALGNG
jgi:hypothetical protein